MTGEQPEQQADKPGAGGMCGTTGKGKGDCEAEPLAGRRAVSRCPRTGLGLLSVSHDCRKSSMEQSLKVWWVAPDS
ncbi:hypothetical protein GCM10018953_18090 [Streptosporangium nondiastaticum]